MRRRSFLLSSATAFVPVPPVPAPLLRRRYLEVQWRNASGLLRVTKFDLDTRRFTSHDLGPRCRKVDFSYAVDSATQSIKLTVSGNAATDLGWHE